MYGKTSNIAPLSLAGNRDTDRHSGEFSSRPSKKDLGRVRWKEKGPGTAKSKGNHNHHDDCGTNRLGLQLRGLLLLR